MRIRYEQIIGIGEKCANEIKIHISLKVGDSTSLVIALNNLMCVQNIQLQIQPPPCKEWSSSYAICYTTLGGLDDFYRGKCFILDFLNL